MSESFGIRPEPPKFESVVPAAQAGPKEKPAEFSKEKQDCISAVFSLIAEFFSQLLKDFVFTCISCKVIVPDEDSNAAVVEKAVGKVLHQPQREGADKIKGGELPSARVIHVQPRSARNPEPKPEPSAAALSEFRSKKNDIQASKFSPIVLMKTQLGRDVLTEFGNRTHASENIEFLKAVADFKQKAIVLGKESDPAKRAVIEGELTTAYQAIMKDFISNQRINLPDHSDQYGEIANDLAKPQILNEHTFDKAEACISDMVKNNLINTEELTRLERQVKG